MNRRTCSRCGRPVDEQTGLCPSCDGYAASQHQDSGQWQQGYKYGNAGYGNPNGFAFAPPGGAAAPAKQSSAKAIIGIVAAALGILAVLGVIILGVSQGWFGGKHNNTEQQIPTDYMAYLDEVVLPSLGTYEPNAGDEGICSALVRDLDKDGRDDMLVASKESENGKSVVKLRLYTTDKDGNIIDNEPVLLPNPDPIPAPTPQPQPDPTPNPDSTSTTTTESGGSSGIDIAFEEVEYYVEYEGKYYVIHENVSYDDTYTYEAIAYTIKNSKLVEVSNVFVPDLSKDNARLVYSKQLPDRLKIKNNDFEPDSFDGGKTILDTYGKKGNSILYFSKSGETDSYEYNSHYASVDAAVADFFRSYGITKTHFVTKNEDETSLRAFLLERPQTEDNYLYSHTLYYQKDNDNPGKLRQIQEFYDYTGWQSLIREEKVVDDDTFIYQEVIDYYLSVRKNGYEIPAAQDGTTGSEDSFVNYELLNAGKENPSAFHLYYTELDLNDDGVNELLLASGIDEEHLTFNDLFTYRNGKCVRLFDRDMGGLRSNFEILSGNAIKAINGSGSEYSIIFYQLPKDADKLMITDSVSQIDGVFYEDTEKDGALDEDSIITEARFNEVLGKYKEANTVYTWKEIKADDEAAPAPAIPAEEAVDIYLKNYQVWKFQDEDDLYITSPLRYAFWDLDGDGVLELISSVGAGSGQYSWDAYYTIDPTTKAVKELDVSVLDNSMDPGQYDVFSGTDNTKLYKNKKDNSLMYFCWDFEHISVGENNQSFGTLEYRDNQVTEKHLFSQYHCDAGKYGNDEETNDYYYFDKDAMPVSVSKEEYDERQKTFLADYEPLNWKYETFDGNEFDTANDAQRKEMLTKSYKAFAY